MLKNKVSVFSNNLLQFLFAVFFFSFFFFFFFFNSPWVVTTLNFFNCRLGPGTGTRFLSKTGY